VTSAMAAFGIAIGGASLACYLLMTRSETRRARRGSSRDGSGPDGGNYAESNHGSMFSWFGSDHSATDSSGNPVDGGGVDSGGGSDGGGGGDGGGGSD
jgi:hypothetical protein